eukprot:10075288-Alexandrium_andersonii.AAC.1
MMLIAPMPLYAHAWILTPSPAQSRATVMLLYARARILAPGPVEAVIIRTLLQARADPRAEPR